MYSCPVCLTSFSTKYNRNRHINAQHNPSFQGFKCNCCRKTFTRKSQLSIHKRGRCHGSIPSGEESVVTSCQHGGVVIDHSDTQETVTISKLLYPTPLKTLLKENWEAVKTYFRCRKVVDIFNFRLINQQVSITDALCDVWLNKTPTQVKLQCCLGYVLKNSITSELRYFHSSANNTMLFDKPVTIKSLNDIQKIADFLEDLDMCVKAKANRPNSSWGVLHVTNISFYLSKLPFPKIGRPCSIPNHIKKLKCVQTLIRGVNNKPVDDNLCFFRALYLNKNCMCKKRCDCLFPKESLPKIYDLYNSYAKHAGASAALASCFQGVSLDDLRTLEKIFDIKISVYSLSRRNKCTLVFQSFSKSKIELNLCLVGNHFCYIKDISAFSKCFTCTTCKLSFPNKHNLLRHKKTCAKEQSLYKYDKDVFHPTLSIFDQIENRTGLTIPDEYRFYPFRATFDIECYLPKSCLTNTPKLTFNNDHKLMSISVCSNIPGYTDPFCLVSDGDSDELVRKFVVFLSLLSDVAYSLCLEKIAPLLETLEKLESDRMQTEIDYSHKQWSHPNTYSSNSVNNLIERLKAHFAELPVISFNGQKYDLNVIRTPLVKHLCKVDQIKFAIKRNNCMKCIKTSKLKFLDATNYIAPGFSYENFLKAYNCSTQKGFFPYEYITSLEKLEDCSLPPHSAFYSSLKQTNISNDEYDYCKAIWEYYDMQTLRDFLIWYNNLDVVPFLEALEKQSDVYVSKGLDMFKDAVSVPSLATKWMFKESSTNLFSIPLISKKNSDLHKTVRENIVGGPAIVFHRYHESDKTYIKSNKYGSSAKSCKQIKGYDANSLYLYAAMQPLPTGTMIRRRSEDNFFPSFVDYYGRMANEWLEFKAHTSGKHIRHKYNQGEIHLGQHALPVDGFCKETKTVYQFHGCVFHGCQRVQCPNTNGQTINPINAIPYKQLYQDTLDKENYLKGLGFNLISIFECQWMKQKAASAYISNFVANLTYREMSERKTMSETEIVAAVTSERFFGLVECDLHVPDHLKDKFQEMPPIFKNVSITRDDLSPLMKSFAEKTNIYRNPQRSLIGSMFGKKILVLTSLLKWYIDHGLKVTKVYQVIQFKKHRCFQEFGEQICNERRLGDADPSTKVRSDTAKLSGNAIYGATITNKERFTDIKYTTDLKIASSYVNKKNFMSIEELDDDVFEIEMSKRKIKLDTPIVIGFSILQIAKLRMLQFYYDFMCKYFHDSCFEYVCMDTDSAYFATCGELETLIFQHMRKQFYEEYDRWFIPPFCSAHKHAFVRTKLKGLPWSMQACCLKVRNYHKRTPGLFKEEFSGNGIVALNAKTYHTFNSTTSKTSTKGIMRNLNKFTKTDFLQTLNSTKPTFGINKGIMRKKNAMVTYTQLRSGLSYFYAKRFVCADGVSTRPLHL